MRQLTKDQLINRLVKQYPDFERSVLTWEDDLNGTRIRVSAEDGIEDRNGDVLFDYWAMSDRYLNGVIYHLDRWLKRNGWWAQWINAGEIHFWKLK